MQICSEAGEEVVIATRGGGRGAKCFPNAIPSNCKSSDCVARFTLLRPQRILLDATNPEPRDVARYRNTLIIYAVIKVDQETYT